MHLVSHLSRYLCQNFCNSRDRDRAKARGKLRNAFLRELYDALWLSRFMKRSLPWVKNAWQTFYGRMYDSRCQTWVGQQSKYVGSLKFISKLSDREPVPVMIDWDFKICWRIARSVVWTRICWERLSRKTRLTTNEWSWRRFYKIFLNFSYFFLNFCRFYSEVCSKNTRTVWIIWLQLVLGESTWWCLICIHQPIRTTATRCTRRCLY